MASDHGRATWVLYFSRSGDGPGGDVAMAPREARKPEKGKRWKNDGQKNAGHLKSSCTIS